MAHVRKDTLAKTLQWWKHLRPYWKRRQQRRERVAAAKLMQRDVQESDDFIAGVRKGLAEIERREVVSLDEVERKIDKWAAK
jgi:predicted transcriptional regulator